MSVCVYEASVLGSGCIAAGSWQSGQISTELSTERRAVGHMVTVMFTGDFMCAEGVAVLSALGCSKGVCLRFGSSNLQVAELR